MKTSSKLIITILALSFFPIMSLHAQEKGWTLREAIEYARDNNIQVQSQQISKEMSDIELEQARSSLFPTLNFSTNQNMSNSNIASYNDFMEESSSTSFGSSYSINSGVTLFNGGRLRNTIKQKEIQNKASGYDVEQVKTDIEINVTQAYLQILYSNETLKLAEEAVSLSEAQLERAQEMYKAGAISKAEVATLQSQLASDKYQVVSSQASLSANKLKLKQLLELELNEDFDVYFPDIDDSHVLATIPSLEDVYNTALNELPDMKSSSLNIEAAEIAVEIAKASMLPTITANANMSTSVSSSTHDNYFKQLNNKLNENIGVSINVPIFNNKQARSNVSSAKQQSLSVKLQDQSKRKQLLSTIESLYNDVVSAQSKYVSTIEQLTAAELSYKIVSEQFNAGLKNSIELVSEMNKYLNAQASHLQAKYEAVLALKLLNVYQNEPITL